MKPSVKAGVEYGIKNAYGRVPSREGIIRLFFTMTEFENSLKITAQKEREDVLDEVLSILEERGYYHKEVLKLKNVKK